MPRGRPPNPGTVEEKAAARRERVRQNVRALRERRKQEVALLNDVDEVSQLKLEWVNSGGPIESTREDDEEPSSSDSTSKCRSSTTSKGTASTSSSSSGTLFVINQKNNAIVKFPRSVDTKSPYAAAIMGTVRQQFLPDSIYLPPAVSKTGGKPWESDHFLWTPCAFWVTNAHARASSQDHSLLKTALLAIGMLLKSMEHRDASLRTASIEMYRRCLGGIRKILEPLSAPNAKRPHDTVSLYLACHASAMFELVQNSDLSASMHHLRGISSLICYLGEDGTAALGKSTAWMLLQDYRFAEMGLCLKFRYASLSSVKRRQYENANFPELQFSKKSIAAFGSGSHSMLVTIADIGDEIADVMVKLDQLRLHLTKSDTLSKIKILIQHLDLVLPRYDTLYAQLSARYGSAFVVLNDGDDSTGLGHFKFQNFDIGTAWIYCLMTQLYCLETSIEACKLLLQVKQWVNSMPSPPDSKASDDNDEDVAGEVFDEGYLRNKLRVNRTQHRRICVQLSQCLQYFLQTDKGITGLSLSIFPLDAAACMLDVEMARLDVDIFEAKNIRASLSSIETLSKQRAEMQIARLVCYNMQSRAEAYGLPSFYTTGSAEGDVAEAADISPPNQSRMAGNAHCEAMLLDSGLHTPKLRIRASDDQIRRRKVHVPFEDELNEEVAKILEPKG